MAASIETGAFSPYPWMTVDADFAYSRARFTLDVYNVFNTQASDIEYFYASRLPGEPLAGVDDAHFHPVDPRTVRAGLTLTF